jgi:hypothetical protein
MVEKLFLHGCVVAWLHVAWLHGLHCCMVCMVCMVVWLHGYMVLLFIDLVVFVGMFGHQLSRTVGQELVLLYNNISNRTHCRTNKVMVFKHQKPFTLFILYTSTHRVHILL